MTNYFNIADDSDATQDDHALALLASYQCRESSVAIRHLHSHTCHPQTQRMLLEVAAQRTALTLMLTGTSRLDYHIVTRLALHAKEQQISYEDLRSQLASLPDPEALELLSNHDRRVSQHLRGLVRKSNVIQSARKLSSAIAEFQITSDRLHAGLQELKLVQYIRSST